MRLKNSVKGSVLQVLKSSAQDYQNILFTLFIENNRSVESLCSDNKNNGRMELIILILTLLVSKLNIAVAFETIETSFANRVNVGPGNADFSLHNSLFLILKRKIHKENKPKLLS